MVDEQEYHDNKLPNKVYVSKRLTTGVGGVPRAFRIASKVIDSADRHQFASEYGELVLRVTSGGRTEVKVKFYEDDRSIFGITLQRFSRVTREPRKESFSFVGDEITRFMEFLLNVCRVRLPSPENLNINDETFRRMLLSPERLTNLIHDNQEKILAWVRSEATASDIVALGYRRKQLEHFRKLLLEPEYFESQRRAESITTTAEGVWQRFFEGNKWIFGFGLTYIFLSNLQERNLEQVVAGADIWGEGKRADGVLKTRGAIEALCLVEIKKHDTPLLKEGAFYRSGCWSPSDELTGGIVQSQATVEKVIRRHDEKYEPNTRSGDPTGEALFAYQPRSYLVIGRLDEFQTEQGPNIGKYRSFELFRRNTIRPEIITFDELYERARFIVEHAES
jgi:hypothetical protein